MACTVLQRPRENAVGRPRRGATRDRDLRRSGGETAEPKILAASEREATALGRRHGGCPGTCGIHLGRNGGPDGPTRLDQDGETELDETDGRSRGSTSRYGESLVKPSWKPIG